MRSADDFVLAVEKDRYQFAVDALERFVLLDVHLDEADTEASQVAGHVLAKAAFRPAKQLQVNWVLSH
jgi:hypothetical protein